MLARLHVIISSENENDENHIKQLLMNMNDNFSISPSRPYALLKNHNEFFITFHVYMISETIQNSMEPNLCVTLVKTTNNYWVHRCTSWAYSIYPVTRPKMTSFSIPIQEKIKHRL